MKRVMIRFDYDVPVGTPVWDERAKPVGHVVSCQRDGEYWTIEADVPDDVVNPQPMPSCGIGAAP